MASSLSALIFFSSYFPIKGCVLWTDRGIVSFLSSLGSPGTSKQSFFMRREPGNEARRGGGRQIVRKLHVH